MRKVLVTGAAGFVGRHLVQALLAAGDEVHAVDCLAPDSGGIDPADGWPLFEPRAHAAFHFYREDCRSWFGRRGDSDFDCAFHLAAIVGGRAVVEGHPLAAADDLAIDAAFWQWAVRARPRKNVYFSSSAAYPIALQARGRHVVLKEEMVSFEGAVGVPDLTYGWAKVTGEYLARLAFSRHGLRSVCYRAFSGYGEDQSDAYPFPSICRRAWESRGSPTLAVWGSGEQMRDFIHVDDCVAGVLATMDKIDDAGALNLSTGIATSFAEFARLAAGMAGYRPKILPRPDEPEGVFARVGDTAKQKRLGFSAKIDLATGIGRALERLSRAGPAKQAAR